MYKIKRTFLNFIVGQEVEKEKLEKVFQPEYIKMLINDRFLEEVKKPLPKTWEELNTIGGYYINTGSEIKPSTQYVCDENKNLFRTEEQAKASIALAQLSQLMYVYNEGWTPDQKDGSQLKYTITYSQDSIAKNAYTLQNAFLAFKTKEIRNEFLENFEHLILTAKPLL